jgi:glycosyltransferase involved in cell wall biosynthesis
VAIDGADEKAGDAAARVSVVIPFLDGDNYIREAVESVFAQTFGDWELLLVDDGSRDASARYARDLAKREPRVRYLAHPGGGNRGTAQSRRLGLENARGEYVLFLDHDDLLLADSLKRLAVALDAFPDAGAVFAGVRHRRVDASASEDEFVSTFHPFGSGRAPRRALLRDMIRSDRNHPATCSTMLRKRALDTIRKQAPAYDSPIYEDSAELFALLAQYDVILLDEAVAVYRLHSQSKSATAARVGTYADTPWCEDRLHFLRWVARNIHLDLATRALLAACVAGLPVVGWSNRLARKLLKPLRDGWRSARSV